MPSPQLVQLHPLPEGALVILDGSADYDAILTELEQVLKDESENVRGTSLIVDVVGRNLSTDEVLGLEELVNRQLGTRVLQIVSNEANEILSEEGIMPAPAGSPSPLPQAAQKPGPSTEAPAADPTPDSARAYILRRTIRSGQRVTYDGSIVVLGDVNAGAEVIAGGDIVVIGTLRGTVHAGARGRITSCVVALRMSPVQIRIAHVIGRAPDESTGSNDPEVAYVRGGQIVVESLAARPDPAIWQGGNALWVGR